MSNYLLVIFKDHIIYISKVIWVTRGDRIRIFRPDINGSCSYILYIDCICYWLILIQSHPDLVKSFTPWDGISRWLWRLDKKLNDSVHFATFLQNSQFLNGLLQCWAWEFILSGVVLRNCYATTVISGDALTVISNLTVISRKCERLPIFRLFFILFVSFCSILLIWIS